MRNVPDAEVETAGTSWYPSSSTRCRSRSAAAPPETHRSTAASAAGRTDWNAFMAWPRWRGEWATSARPADAAAQHRPHGGRTYPFVPPRRTPVQSRASFFSGGDAAARRRHARAKVLDDGGGPAAGEPVVEQL